MDRTPAFGAPARILPRDDWTRVPAAPELGAVLHTLDELNAPDYEAEDELEDATRVPPQRTFATLRAIGRSALPVGTLLAYAGDYAVLLVRLEPTGVHGYGVRLLEVRTPGVLGARRSVVALVTHMRLHARLTIAVTESRVELAEYNALHTLLLELGLHPPGAGTPAQELEWAVDALENAAAIADVHENSLHQLSDADARDLVSTYERTGTGEPELARLAFALLRGYLPRPLRYRPLPRGRWPRRRRRDFPPPARRALFPPLFGLLFPAPFVPQPPRSPPGRAWPGRAGPPPMTRRGLIPVARWR